MAAVVGRVLTPFGLASGMTMHPRAGKAVADVLPTAGPSIDECWLVIVKIVTNLPRSPRLIKVLYSPKCVTYPCDSRFVLYRDAS